MHLFTPAVGLKKYSLRPAMDKLIKKIIQESVKTDNVIYAENGTDSVGFYESQINKVMVRDGKKNIAGISIRGSYNPEKKKFIESYFFPYAEGSIPYFNKELSIERLSDKEAYMVHCNETQKDISPIFFMRNIVEYLNTYKGQKTICERMVFMSGLAIDGKIILPIKKTDEQIARCNAAVKKRNTLINRALQGDMEAMDSLTIGDYDTISDIYRRVRKEDIYSVVDSSFIPTGLECDVYSVVGNIKEVSLLKNDITDEDIYYMSLECNSVEFDLVINKEDLLGEPHVGYRFVGRIWLQGNLFVDE